MRGAPLWPSRRRGQAGASVTLQRAARTDRQVPASASEVSVTPQRNVEKRLKQVRDELARTREALRIIDEQIAYQREVAHDAATRAAVSATPLADRQRREAAQDLHRLERQRGETAARVAELLEEQDELLERLLPGPGRARA